MDLENIWSVFLSKIEIKLKPVLYQTWFQDTKLIDLNNEYAIVEVPLDVHKKHLSENYGEIIKETFLSDKDTPINKKRIIYKRFK